MPTPNRQRISVMMDPNTVTADGLPASPPSYWNSQEQRYKILTASPEVYFEGSAVPGDRLAIAIIDFNGSDIYSLGFELRDAGGNVLKYTVIAGHELASDSVTFSHYFLAATTWRLYILGNGTYDTGVTFASTEHYACDNRNMLGGDNFVIEAVGQEVAVLARPGPIEESYKLTCGSGPSPFAEFNTGGVPAQAADRYISLRIARRMGE